MEWAYELINGFKTGDARATRRSCARAATSSCRSSTPTASTPRAPPAPAPARRRPRRVDRPTPRYIVAGTANGGEYRRKNCRVDEHRGAATARTSAGLAEPGIDPNRNYGGLWGGPGAEHRRPPTQTYRGPGAVLRARDAQHPVARLAQPGDDADHQPHDGRPRAARARPAVLGDPIDENRGYKALGDDDGARERLLQPEGLRALRHDRDDRGLELQRHRRLRLHVRDLLRRPELRRPATATTRRSTRASRRWSRSGTGTSPQSNHVDRPRQERRERRSACRRTTTARATARRTTSPPRARSTRRATASSRATRPAGATLRLTKAFKTETYPQAAGRRDAKPLDSSTTSSRRCYDVAGVGHVPLAHQPVDAADRRQGPRARRRRARRARRRRSRPTEAGTVPCTPVLVCAAGNDDQHVRPSRRARASTTARSASASSGTTQASDYDLKIYRPGASADSTRTRSRSSAAARRPTSRRSRSSSPTGEYLIRVANVNAASSRGAARSPTRAPSRSQPGKTETWTLTCEVGGQVLQTTQVLIDRGEVKQPDLGACDRRVPAQLDGRARPAGAGTPPRRRPRPRACRSRGFRSVVRARARPAASRLGFARAVQRPVTVDVFQQSVGRRVIGERLVARYTNRARSFTWNGQGQPAAAAR